MSCPKDIFIRGSIGTGKTYLARRVAYGLCKMRQSIDDAFEKANTCPYDEVENFIDSDFCEFIQCYESLCIDDLIYGVELNAKGSGDFCLVPKRIKILCDRASSDKDNLYAIILDDINRIKDDFLLGPFLYAKNNRDSKVEFSDGTVLVIPNNVALIFTDDGTTPSSTICSLFAQTGYIKENYSNRQSLIDYYEDISAELKPNHIVEIYDIVQNFCKKNMSHLSAVQISYYTPGHCCFYVSKSGGGYLVYSRFKSKFRYQVTPYLVDLMRRGLLVGDISDLLSSINAIINLGEQESQDLVTIAKVFVNSKTQPDKYTLEDTKKYFEDAIAQKSFLDRDLLECIIDAIVLNKNLPNVVALRSLFTNTAFTHVNADANLAKVAYFAKISDAEKYFYETPKNGTKVSHAFFSTKKARNGRWSNELSAIGYRVSVPSSGDDIYIPLNGVRHHNFTIDTASLNTENNACEIYRAVYFLIEKYLDVYFENIRFLYGSSPDTKDLLKLIQLEQRLLKNVHETVKKENGDQNRYVAFFCNLTKFRTLWYSSGTALDVDQERFDLLFANADSFSLDAYDAIFSKNNNKRKQIILKGVIKMADISDYQAIMDNIGVRQLIFQGPPGTSKTFECKKFVLKQLTPQAPSLAKENATQADISNDLNELKLTSDDYEKDPLSSTKFALGGWDIVQFHPSYGYEDFIRGIKVKTANGSPVYETVNRVLGKIAYFAAKAATYAKQKDADIPKFYLIIDEINRANLATVFGELIYGLEYRNSAISTPYEVMEDEKETSSITLPDNLYIVGTMNTADRSIGTIDYAIRRRFLFIDSPPLRNVIVNSCLACKGNDSSFEIQFFDAVQAIFDNKDYFNDDYQKSDVRLGHTYFLRTSEKNHVDVFVERFLFQVIPILREYIKDGILYVDTPLIDFEYLYDEEFEWEKNISDSLPKFLISVVKYFGEKTTSGEIIDNAFVERRIRNVIREAGI